MRDRLQRCEAELRPLVSAAWSCPTAREDARAYNEEVDAVRAALLEPALDLVARGRSVRDLAACLERRVAELAFWRRVLRGLYGDAFGSDASPSDYLVRWVTG